MVLSYCITLQTILRPKLRSEIKRCLNYLLLNKNGSDSYTIVITLGII